MNNFEKNLIQTQDSTKNQNEKLDLRIELAQPDDWEECKKIRLASLSGEEAGMLTENLPKILKHEMERGEKEWREEISGVDTFVVISRNGLEVIGIGRARKMEKEGENVWRLYNGYVLPEFQGKHIGRKIFGLRLKEVASRGGEKITTNVRVGNSKSLNIMNYFGCKKIDQDADWDLMELDLTDPGLIQKINLALDER